jgi:prepilin-type N-terminal cleavage/methylation domain-containing protein
LASSAQEAAAVKHGFTLIELLMVIVIIGILTTILIPRFANTRQAAFVAAMKSDLRNLATAEEAYYYDNSTYAPSIAMLSSYNTTAGVAVVVIQASQGGWSGTASSINTPRQCFLFVGNATPIGVATAEGQVACN